MEKRSKKKEVRSKSHVRSPSPGASSSRPVSQVPNPISYDFSSIESKWQRKWESSKTFVVKEDSKKKKCYVLEMFPYPSGSGLHMGHAFNYSIGDIFARYKRMNACNVLYPMGYDSFGLPAENAAIKAGVHPLDFTDESIKNFVVQQKAIGLSYDWSRMLKTSDEEYYRWNQFLFLKLMEKGLVYRKDASINWCSKCTTVLANEQVHNGACWRHKDVPVEVKQLEQWFIKTTAYADELLRDVDALQWPDRIKSMQKNWIGKSYGTNINFTINKKVWTIFTTRPDTLFGVTFLVVSAQHQNLSSLVTPSQKLEVEIFLKKIHSTKQEDVVDLEKDGVFTGSYAEHPLSGEKIPVYAGNFVVADYGSGMVMAVPAHDQRDFDFAKKYGIPLKVVVQPKGKGLTVESMTRAYTDDGILTNSGQFNNVESSMAKEKITDFLISKKKGEKTIQYKLRDWLVSRQRYWGTPIPIVYCEKCGIVPVPERDLPVSLPYNVMFGSGNPLLTSKDFVWVKCPKCKMKARRETDTMDTFFDSSWYFLRFTDNKNVGVPFDKKKAMYWMPVDQYIGGAEHACMHLIYARFFMKALSDIGLVNSREPFPVLFNQGMIHGEDGAVMSKSRGNVIDPLKIIRSYGADSLRAFLVSVASPDKDFAWSDSGVESVHKLVQKIFLSLSSCSIGTTSHEDASRIHSALKHISSDIEKFKYNNCIIIPRSLYDHLGSELSKDDLHACIQMISPFCPHISEELWELHGGKGFVSQSSWPLYVEKKIDVAIDVVEEMVEQTIKDILQVIQLRGIVAPQKVTLFVAEPWKYDALTVISSALKESRDVGTVMKKVLEKKELKMRGQEVSALVQKMLKDPKKMAEIVLNQEKEIVALENAKEKISLMTKTPSIVVLKSQDSSEQKARQSMPGKPALLIE